MKQWSGWKGGVSGLLGEFAEGYFARSAGWSFWCWQSSGINVFLDWRMKRATPLCETAKRSIGLKKPINISELLRLMYDFDIEEYPDDVVATIQSYSGKAQVFKRYKDA